MDSSSLLPRWAARVPQAKVRLLYRNDARGIYDEDLIDDVGYGLLARCQSFLTANEAAQGRALCPLCGKVIPHTGDKAAVLRCGDCNWQLTWGEFFETFQGKQLFGAEPVLALFREYVARFSVARTAREKVLEIDRLIHGWHWYQKHGHTRPVAVNLIEGKLGEVIAFLDSITYSEDSTPGTAATHAEWVKNSENVRQWGRAPKPDEGTEGDADQGE